MEIELLSSHSINYNLSGNNNYTWFFTFIGSFAVALTIYFLNRRSDKKNRNDEIVKLLKSDIFTLCEKMIRHAIHCSRSLLRQKYTYALYKINADGDLEINRNIHLEQFSKAIDEQRKIDILRADLIEKIHQLEIYWSDKDSVNKILNLMSVKGLSISKDASGIFNKEMDIDTIKKTYIKEESLIVNYVTKESQGKELREVQFILYPKYKDRL